MADVPLPEWVKEIYPHQAIAVQEIVEAFQRVPVVMLDAPTGTGKTLVAELVRRELDRKSLYVATDNSLVNQMARDFPYAKVLKGRANYLTEYNSEMTADDCTSRGPDSPCLWCGDIWSCPYQIAKREALAAPLAVTNTAYLLAEANRVGKFSGRQFIVADEADTLEGILMGFVEYSISATRIKDFGMEEPGKGIHKPTLVTWLNEFNQNVGERFQVETDPKKSRRLKSLMDDTSRVTIELQREVDKKQAGESDGRWIRNYDTRYGGLHLKPVMVDSYGTRQLWRHAKSWLLMSATIISPDEVANSLGLPLDYEVVSVPMTFPKENRQVIMAPVANVVFKEMDKAVPKLVYAIHKVMEKHPDDRILVHTVSYNLAKKLQDGLRHYPGIGRRRIITYMDGRERERILAEYKQTPGCVMLAPSMDRGIDLPGDLCRVQVIAKVPFLSMGDTQVSRRIHLPGGEHWYCVQAIRTLVQMTGRAVRHKDDWAICYVFDEQFSSNLWRKHKNLFPKWWISAVNVKTSIREFIQ